MWKSVSPHLVIESVATIMTSIPLLCNICPKEPEFSDISHLLTHVASKGHLAQELRAKVRSRQDTSIREKLNNYDRWYERHQIEKLLSQRLILKESKDTNGKIKRLDNSPPAGSAKNVKPRKKRANNSKIVPEASPVKSEEALIDPQLSWFPPSSPSPFLGLPGHNGLPEHDQAFNHRFHIPRMCAVQDAQADRRADIPSTPTKIPSSKKISQGPSQGSDSEDDYFNYFIRSPTRTAYPDPSDFIGRPFGFSPLRAIEQARENANSTPNPNDQIEKVQSMQAPVLKGVKWPGMSIFDSASLEAQRLRNQRKDGSIVEQMEHNAGAVEQIERIYWPDGSLKQERLITGNVESSPMKEPTPPPKRQRTRAKKTVLKDLSTNAPKQSRRARKTVDSSHAKQASELRNISKKALAALDSPPPRFIYPKSAHMSYDVANEEDLERRLIGENVSGSHRPAFSVFNDDVGFSQGAKPGTLSAKSGSKKARNTGGYPFLQNAHGHQGPLHSYSTDFPARRTPLETLRSSAENQHRSQPDGLPWEPQLRSFGSNSKIPMPEEDRENIEPVLNGDGRIDVHVSQAHNERVTQRFFSITGNQPPQFFNSLPPHMDFGGLPEPKYYGSTLNLLNPYLLQQHPPKQYPPALFHNPSPSFRASRQDDKDKSARPPAAKNGSSHKAEGPRF